MKITTCDQCGKQEKAGAAYGEPPTTWYFFRRGDYSTPEQHLCSLECLVGRALDLKGTRDAAAQADAMTAKEMI